MGKNYTVIASHPCDFDSNFEALLKSAYAVKGFDYFDDAESYFHELVDSWDYRSVMEVVLFIDAEPTNLREILGINQDN